MNNTLNSPNWSRISNEIPRIRTAANDNNNNNNNNNTTRRRKSVRTKKHRHIFSIKRGYEIHSSHSLSLCLFVCYRIRQHEHTTTLTFFSPSLPSLSSLLRKQRRVSLLLHNINNVDVSNDERVDVVHVVE